MYCTQSEHNWFYSVWYKKHFGRTREGIRRVWFVCQLPIIFPLLDRLQRLIIPQVSNVSVCSTKCRMKRKSLKNECLCIGGSLWIDFYKAESDCANLWRETYGFRVRAHIILMVQWLLCPPSFPNFYKWDAQKFIARKILLLIWLTGKNSTSGLSFFNVGALLIAEQPLNFKFLV